MMLVYSYLQINNSPLAPVSVMPDLIKLVHGNKNSRKNLADEFVSYALNKDPSLNLSSLCVRKKMKEISSWQVTACCWYVYLAR